MVCPGTSDDVPWTRWTLSPACFVRLFRPHGRKVHSADWTLARMVLATCGCMAQVQTVGFAGVTSLVSGTRLSHKKTPSNEMKRHSTKSREHVSSL